MNNSEQDKMQEQFQNNEDDKKSILVVDDEEIITASIQEFLAGSGYGFIIADSGQQALDVLNSRHVDLVLLDIMMPEMDGLQVCRKIKENPKTRNIPVLMITSLADINARIKAMEAGADDFLMKPVDRIELQIRAKSLLRIKSYYDELTRSRDILREKNAKLEEAKELKDDLIHMIVHDLKSPLNPLTMCLELLKTEKHNFSTEKQQWLDIARKNCIDLKGMIDEILIVARMEENKMTLNRAPGNLEVLTGYALDSLDIQIKSKNISLNIAAVDEFPGLMFDHSIIQRVIFNLADNASRHTPKNGKIDVTMGLGDDSKKIYWSICNSGECIPESMHEKIFHKFEQAANRRIGLMTGKSGLGLPFCKIAIEAHGGELWLENNTNEQGARFIFTLPLNQEA